MIGRPPIWTIEDPEQDDTEIDERPILTTYRKKITALLRDKGQCAIADMLRAGCVSANGVIIAWVDENGQIDYAEYPIHEVVPVYDGRGRLVYALRKYSVTMYVDGQEIERTRLEVYDDRYVSYYISDADNNFTLDKDEARTGNPIEHHAGRIPVVVYQNYVPARYKERKKGYGVSDLSTGVYELLLAYCHAESDKANLAAYLQDMYLLLTGVDVDEGEVLKMRKARALALKSTESKAGFIAQDQDDQTIEHYMNRLREDIFNTTGTPRLSELTGTTAYEVKMKYASLDIKAGKKEPRLLQAIGRLVEILTDFLNAKILLERGTKNVYSVLSDAELVAEDGDLYRADWLQVSLVRNLPQNYKEIADIVAVLKDTVPDSYLYELLWFIDDSQKALDEMKAQKQGEADANMVALGYNEHNFGSIDGKKALPDQADAAAASTL